MGTSRLRVVATAIVAVLGATAAGVAAQDAATAPGGGLLLKAVFADASPILVGNDVKVDGVPVGSVSATDVQGNRAVVTMLLDPAALPVHRDARFTIRPVSLLGERFVDLDRGTAAAPTLRTGDTVPVAQTTTNTDLDEVLDTIDKPTGEGLSMLVTTLGGGLQGNGANADATIRALAPALNDTTALAKVLKDQNTLLNELVDRVTPVAGSLAADNGRNLDQLVASANTLLAATAQQQKQLEATLAELPATLTSARTTLDRVTGTAAATTPTLADLRPATDDLRAISGELYSFADSLDPALAGAEPVLDRGRELLTEAAPVVAQLRAAGPDLRTDAAAARPIVDELTGNLDNVYNFIRYWAMTANGRDGLSTYFRGFVVVNPQSATGLLPQGLQALPLPGAVEPGAASGAVPPAVGGLLAPEKKTDPKAGATGLDQQQENGIVGFLLGGKG
jgi:phospholipid/cholesterol/gamma-HCH transport system substrate-binding protein